MHKIWIGAVSMLLVTYTIGWAQGDANTVAGQPTISSTPVVQTQTPVTQAAIQIASQACPELVLFLEIPAAAGVSKNQ